MERFRPFLSLPSFHLQVPRHASGTHSRQAVHSLSLFRVPSLDSLAFFPFLCIPLGPNGYTSRMISKCITWCKSRRTRGINGLNSTYGSLCTRVGVHMAISPLSGDQRERRVCYSLPSFLMPFSRPSGFLFLRHTLSGSVAIKSMHVKRKVGGGG